MPLFSDHISNMYYSGSPLYSSSSYGYNSSVLPLGNSYSATYLNSGGNYSNHSSLGYSRTPLTSRWISGVGRSYSPMLSTISERSTASPVRINSPRRIPITKRSYGSSGYITRPININTADIDVSRDKYRKKTEPVVSPPQRKESPRNEKEKENSPFMPRVDGKPETGIDSSPGVPRSTIKRGRTVVRLHTIKRKDRDSPRKPAQSAQCPEASKSAEKALETETLQSQSDLQEPTRWRERLSDDLIYKDKKVKKTIGTKLAEKFMVRDLNKDNTLVKAPIETILPESEASQNLHVTPISSTSQSRDRRCSIEILAEQAKLFDSLIRKENLSTTSLDLSKVGIVEEPKGGIKSYGPIKRRKSNDKHNPLKTTQSDHSLHDTLKSSHKPDTSKNLSKKRSLKKSNSGSSICRLDSITEFPKEPLNLILPAIDETKSSIIKPEPTIINPEPTVINAEPTIIHPEPTVIKPKAKFKTKITASVEVSPPKSPLKFRIDDVVVEEKPRILKKGISFSSTVEAIPLEVEPTLTERAIDYKDTQINYNTTEIQPELPSPEPEDGNFWNKIGKRETVYLIKRKQIINDAKQKHKLPFFWLPEEETFEENVTENDKDIIRDKDRVNNAIISDDNINSENITNSTTSTAEINESDNLPDNISNKNLDDNALKEVSPKNFNTKEISKTIEIKEQSQNDFLRKNQMEFSVGKENRETNESCPWKDSTVNNDKNQSSLKDNIIKDEKPESIQIDTSLKNTNKKQSLLNEHALIPKQTNKLPLRDKASTKEKALQNKETSSKDLKTKKVTEEKKSKILSIGLSQKEKEVSKTKDSKKRSHEGGALQPACFTIDKSAVNDTSSFISPKQQTEKDTEAVKQNFKENRNLEEYKDEDKIENTNISKLNKTKDEDSDSKLEKVEHSFEELKNKKTEADKQKSSKVKGMQPNTKSTPTSLKSGKNTDSSKKSASNKICKKELNTLCQENTLKKPEFNQNVVEKQKDLKTNEQDIQNSRFNKTEADIKISGTVKEYSNIKLNTEKDRPLILVKNIMQKPQEPLVIQLEEKISSDAKNSNHVANSSTNIPSAFDTTETDIKASGIDMENNIYLNSEKDQSLTLDENITQKPNETPLVHTEEKHTCNAENSNDGANSSTNNISTTQVGIDESENIPLNENKVNLDLVIKEGNGSVVNADSELILKKEEQEAKQPSVKNILKLPEQPNEKKPVKQEAALRPLIATPRPLQKRAPQVIHSSESSDTSSDEETSDEENDDGDESEGSEEFFECEVNTDGRTSTGSNDSGFDSSAPTSPAGFQQIRKDCDVNCHRKCEKLTANLCGVNQRLLVEALATRTASKKGAADVPGTSTSIAVHSNISTDILEQELEQSTAYGIFRKTGRFTPPARSIPRFRKYTVEDFNFIKVLGKGSFGKVLLAELRDTEYYYAVKCLKKDVVLEDDDVECTLIERKVLALGTNHPYLCHLFATFQTDSHLFFVMEYLNGGDLMFHIQQSGRFPEARARFYAAEIVSGLKFLHKRGIIYRDLKLDNILLDFDGHVRIADFGMCKLQIYLDKTADTFCGTPDYMAPEIIKGLKYNQTVDWWSFGVLLYEMLIGQSPFSGCDEDELFWSICNEMPSYPRFLSQESLTILTRLLDKDARTRLGGTECMHGDIREQAFFHSIHWDRLERRDLEAPFRPRVRHPLDTQYFDRAFTGERPRLTAVEPQVLRSMDQEPFRGFSYTNPNATDR